MAVPLDLMRLLFSSTDEMMTQWLHLLILQPPDDYKIFQELLQNCKQLHIPLEKVQDLQRKLLVILHSSGSSRIAFPVNKAILDPTKVVWHMPATICPYPKRAEKQYYVPAKGVEFLCSHPPPNSSVVQAAAERSRQQNTCCTPTDKDGKHLNLLGRKVFSSSSL